MRPVHFAAARRTPIGKLRGALSAVRPDDLAATVIRHLVADVPALDPARIDDVYWGAANQAGEDNRNVARMAALLAGLPESVPGATVNRLCASGLEAVTTAARTIAAGEAEIVLAGGSESMSRAPFVLPRPDEALPHRIETYDTRLGWRLVNPAMKDLHGLLAMGETAEERSPSGTASPAPGRTSSPCAATNWPPQHARTATSTTNSCPWKAPTASWSSRTSVSARTPRWRSCPASSRSSARAARSRRATPPR
ncbi:hypothetical protein Scel_15720 [Streptomyces cellostaticus]|nr:hypothetical protein Scel_15720 [Streptomyces cellostaticus]